MQYNHQQQSSMRSAVGSLWGGEQVQQAPTFELVREEEETITRELAGGAVTETECARCTIPYHLQDPI